jgi:hypothetical protein
MKFATLRNALCVLALGLTAAACAPGARSGSDPLAMRTVHSSPMMITRTEILAQKTGRNLFDVVLRLRPSFLRGRYGLPTVALDGVLVGNASYLSNVSPDEVESVQLLDGLDATTRFGARHNGAVLVVRTRPR